MMIDQFEILVTCKNSNFGNGSLRNHDQFDNESLTKRVTSQTDHFEKGIFRMRRTSKMRNFGKFFAVINFLSA